MIRQYLVLTLLATLSFSCKKDSAETETVTETKTENTVPEPAAGTITEAVYVYNDSLQAPVKRTEVSQDIKLEQLVEAINKFNGKGNVKLEFMKASPDTVYVKIEDSDYLTRQMGTLGAHAYLSAATYTLTEKAGINYVTFDFEEGDHAVPGTYSRESFKQQQ